MQTPRLLPMIVKFQLNLVQHVHIHLPAICEVQSGVAEVHSHRVLIKNTFTLHVFLLASLP